MFTFFQESGEWCYSSQMGELVHTSGRSVGRGHAGYQSCKKDGDCTYKVERCVAFYTL